MPFIVLFFVIFVARNSAQITKRYGERGSPWRHPRSMLKKADRCPDTDTAEDIFL